MSSENNNLRLPVAPLKIAALESCRELAEKVNANKSRILIFAEFPDNKGFSYLTGTFD